MSWQEHCITSGMDSKCIDSELLNHYSGQIVNSAMKVHTRLGPGLLESTYEACLIHELRKRGLNISSQVELPIEYDGVFLDVGYRIDLLVENCIVVELKAVEKIRPLYVAQTLSYIKLSKLKLGLLINFNTVSLKDGIQRIVNRF